MLSDKPDPGFIDKALSFSTPAFICDASGVMKALQMLKNDLSPFRDPEILFSIKANRDSALLNLLSQAGYGGSIASFGELKCALAAGMMPLSLTTPMLGDKLLRMAVHAGVAVDLDNTTQIDTWGKCREFSRDIGIRIKVPLGRSEREANELTTWSRFGVMLSDQRLHHLLNKHRLTVKRLHLHSGEVRTVARAQLLMEYLSTALQVFPEVELINLGGGFTYLYSDRSAAQQAFAILAKIQSHGERTLGISVEPGMLIVAFAGYLSCSVIHSERRKGDHQIATLDASAWNLVNWSVPRIVGINSKMKDRNELTLSTDLAGCACYENDYFIRGVDLPPLSPGDRVLFRNVGAYSASMARSTHALPVPRQRIIADRCTEEILKNFEKNP